MPLERGFYARNVLEVAPDLLNKVLGLGDCRGRIVEVEAYGGDDDPASHGFRGMTPRTEVMFGPPGRLYVYFTYGMHWCANVVCGADGECAAVLLRALTPLAGLDRMRERRPAARRDRDLCSGPAKLSAALGIDGATNGADLVGTDGGMEIVDDGIPPPTNPGRSTRIGLTAGNDLSWRWYVPGCADLSRRG
ncbi:DNA-3-methyladenine glycosylase [Candidatus Poriferisocius sp.]|uniref:DNA-3-methyladenine glycosylase n=1 Tax=Candidatus Poriferisocius sp. TaxID=3101276 RepID=UPI003B01045A